MAYLTKAQEKIIRKVAAVDGCKVKLEQLDMNDKDLEMDKVDETKLPKSVLEIFKEEYAKQLDLTEHISPVRNQGRFVDEKTEFVWRAFKAALKTQIHAISRSITHLKRKVDGEKKSIDNYIVGLEVKDGTVQFGYRPFKHPNRVQAIKEAERLSQRFDKTYSVYKCVDRVGDQTQFASVEDTKQREEGKALPSYNIVMEKLVKYILNDKYRKVPTGIVFTITGKYRVVTNDFGTYNDFDTYREALLHIHDWIANPNKDLKG